MQNQFQSNKSKTLSNKMRGHTNGKGSHVKANNHLVILAIDDPAMKKTHKICQYQQH